MHLRVARAAQGHVDHFVDAARAADNTTTRSARKTASSTECVTSNVGMRPLPPDALQFQVHTAARDRVQRAERLVQQQHVRIERQRARNRHALLHATRQLPRTSALETRQTNQFQQVLRALARHCTAGQMKSQRHVVECRQPWQQHVILKRDAEPCSRAIAAGSRPANRNRAVGRLFQRRHQSDQRRLAAPDGPSSATNSASPTSRSTCRKGQQPPASIQSEFFRDSAQTGWRPLDQRTVELPNASVSSDRSTS